MRFKRLKFYLSLIILVLPLGQGVVKANEEKQGDNLSSHIIRVEPVEVRGISLAPLINPGDTIKLAYGYYDSHPVEREDIVAYKYGGNDVPIIKFVKAVPGDKWSLKKDENQDSYQIIVNGQALKNSENKYYQIHESKIQMLKLYVKDYPVLPDNTYLILGNKVSGSSDATRFGLIDKSGIVGKVMAFVGVERQR